MADRFLFQHVLAHIYHTVDARSVVHGWLSHEGSDMLRLFTNTKTERCEDAITMNDDVRQLLTVMCAALSCCGEPRTALTAAPCTGRAMAKLSCLHRPDQSERLSLYSQRPTH